MRAESGAGGRRTDPVRAGDAGFGAVAGGLSELWRGRRGTEWASAGHVAGERFVLIEPDVLVTYPTASWQRSAATARVLASGVGDVAGPAEAACADRPARRCGRPRRSGWYGKRAAAAAAIVRWTRRSRAGWRWADGGDAPLVEESERYRVTIGAREVIATEPTATVTAADRSGGAVSVTVRQLGTLAESTAADDRHPGNLNGKKELR